MTGVGPIVPMGRLGVGVGTRLAPGPTHPGGGKGGAGRGCRALIFYMLGIFDPSHALHFYFWPLSISIFVYFLIYFYRIVEKYTMS